MHGWPVLGLAILLLWATTAADAQQQGKPAVVDGLSDMIPIQLLLGNAKYRNPQVSTQAVCYNLLGLVALASAGHRWTSSLPTTHPIFIQLPITCL
jgi:hypothetical protein